MSEIIKKPVEHSICVEMIDSEGTIPRYRGILHVSCSCGFDLQRVGGKRDEAHAIILTHRVSVIEEVLGIKLNVRYIP